MVHIIQRSHKQIIFHNRSDNADWSIRSLRVHLSLRTRQRSVYLHWSCWFYLSLAKWWGDHFLCRHPSHSHSLWVWMFSSIYMFNSSSLKCPSGFHFLDSRYSVHVSREKIGTGSFFSRVLSSLPVERSRISNLASRLRHSRKKKLLVPSLTPFTKSLSTQQSTYGWWDQYGSFDDVWSVKLQLHIVSNCSS